MVKMSEKMIKNVEVLGTFWSFSFVYKVHTAHRWRSSTARRCAKKIQHSDVSIEHSVSLQTRSTWLHFTTGFTQLNILWAFTANVTLWKRHENQTKLIQLPVDITKTLLLIYFTQLKNCTRAYIQKLSHSELYTCTLLEIFAREGARCAS